MVRRETWWRVIRLLGVAGGCGLAVGAQWVLVHRSSARPLVGDAITTAALLFIVAGIVFGAAAVRPERAADRFDPIDRAAPSLRRWVVAVAITAWAVSMVVYFRRGETPLVLAAWAMSILALLAAGYGRGGDDSAVQALKQAWLPLVVILPVAAALRLWRLDTVPLVVFGDIARDGLEIRAMLAGVEPRLIEFTWGLLPRTAFLPQMGTMWLFGETLYGLHMSSVLTGMVSLVATYLLGSELYGRRAGWLATGLLAVSYAHLHFSRVAHGIDPEPWFLFALYCAMRAVRTGATRDAVLAGLFAGVAFQTYYSGRLCVLVLGLAAAHCLVRRRFRLLQWSAVALGFVVALGPLAIFLARHTDLLVQRAQEVSIFNPGIMAHLRYAYRATSDAEVVLEGVKRAFLALAHYPNAFPERRIDFAMFDGFTATCIALGFGYAALGIRYLANWVMCTAFVIIVVLTAGLTSDPPFWQRMEPVLPLAAILAGVALDRIGLFGGAFQRGVGLALFAAITVVGYQNWTGFVASEARRVRPMDLAVRYASTLAPDRPLVVIRPPWDATFFEFRFMAPQVHSVTVLVEDAAAARWPALSGPPVVIFTPEHVRLLSAVQASWPGGTVREFTMPSGGLAFIAYEAP